MTWGAVPPTQPEKPRAEQNRLKKSPEGPCKTCTRRYAAGARDLLQRGIERVVRVAEALPGLVGDDRLRAVARPVRVLDEHGREARLEVHICADTVSQSAAARARGGCAPMWQWKNQGPGLSAMKRSVIGFAPACRAVSGSGIVRARALCTRRVHSPAVSATSRRGGLMMLRGPVALWTTSKEWPLRGG